jgi:hypothetical protein
MPKRTRIRRRNYKKRRTKRRYKKGGDGIKVNCCMCENETEKEKALIPRKCLIKYGEREAHRICQSCWWDPIKGFAQENASHECPGCEKGLPLSVYKKEAPIFIDLTED